jgi:hypothetical protein
MRSAEGHGPDDDEDVEEDERNCFTPNSQYSIASGCACPVRSGRTGGNSLRINVRTELIRLIVLAFTLAPSCAPPPKEGSFCAALPQPTVFVLLVRLF